ncbi:hypothetical protein, partial [Escherichia coli]|uniref:hypothetical protein n=1 Tax=Escherichia coli TaxID=562 RepID=UPI00200F0FF2
MTLRNNAWSTTPPAGYQGTGDINSGVVLEKMTGWQSLSAVDDVTLADFTPTAGSTTLNAGTTNYGTCVSSGDYNGTAIDGTP